MRLRYNCTKRRNNAKVPIQQPSRESIDTRHLPLSFSLALSFSVSFSFKYSANILKNSRCERSSALGKEEARVFLWIGRWHRNNGCDRCATFPRWSLYTFSRVRLFTFFHRPLVLVLAGLMEGSILERMSLLDRPPKGRTSRCISQEIKDISTLLSLRHFPLSRRDSSFLFRFAESPRHRSSSSRRSLLSWR